jgi:hypothetical protein
MSGRGELRAFHGVVGLILLIPLLAGLGGAFFGLEGLARLFGIEEPIAVAPPLRNNLRAICCMFAGWVPLAIWSLASLRERATAFRIVIGSGFLAGFARLTGYRVDGSPGLIAFSIMAIELGVMPILFVWHARLVRRA